MMRMAYQLAEKAGRRYPFRNGAAGYMVFLCVTN